MDEHKLTLRIPKDEHRAVKIRCAERGLTVTTVVRALLKLWVEGKVDLPE